ncbi:hypothetical protein V6Z12_D06G155700 [Gossypium hirsutum]
MAIDTEQKSPSDGKVWGIFKLPFRQTGNNTRTTLSSSSTSNLYVQTQPHAEGSNHHGSAISVSSVAKSLLPTRRRLKLDPANKLYFPYICFVCVVSCLGPAANKKPVTDQQYQKGHQEALILGGLELISAEMIPFNPWPHCGLIHFDACIHLEVHGISAKSETMNQNSKNYVSGIVEQKNLSEFDMSKLGIGFDDEKSERKTSEKALVLSQINV